MKKKAKKKAKPNPALLKKARVAALSKVFQALGAKTPEQWAKAQVDDGSDELGRFVLLRALWLRTVEPGRLLASARKEKSVADAIERVMKKVDLADLDALVRFAQKTALDDVCRVLDDPADNEDGIRWTVYRVDANGMPLWPLAALRKDLVETEPS
jgi:hypothetical protein